MQVKPRVYVETSVLSYLTNWRSRDLVQAAFAANPQKIAGIIVEPVPGNAGLYLPRPGYLEFLREITQREGALLIFDEVMTGFRLGPAGAQGRFGITPDLTCFGKIIGGGLPVGAFGGRADIMDFLAPLGPVYQAGTLSGNPLAMSAGIAACEYMQNIRSAVGRTACGCHELCATRRRPTCILASSARPSPGCPA